MPLKGFDKVKAPDVAAGDRILATDTLHRVTDAPYGPAYTKRGAVELEVTAVRITHLTATDGRATRARVYLYDTPAGVVEAFPVNRLYRRQEA